MLNTPRKKSPRAPTMALDEALERAMRAYDKERLHATPTDVVAQNMGYKGVSSGTALSALAALRYYGLLERPGDGLLAISKEVEAYRHSPSENQKRSFLFNFLRKPALFAELLDQYTSGLPSDATLKEALLERGFLPATATSVLNAFSRSVEFAGYFEPPENSTTRDAAGVESAALVTGKNLNPVDSSVDVDSSVTPHVSVNEGVEHDKIPVRLPGGRRAWLFIPTPFFMADKQRLKAQIDLLLTQEDDVDAAR